MISLNKKLLIAGVISLFTATMAIGFAPMAPDPEDLPATILRHDITLTATPPANPPPPQDYTFEVRIEPKDTLQNILSRLNINDDELIKFIRNTEQAHGLYDLFAYKVFQASVKEDGRVNWLRYIHTPSNNDKGVITTSFIEIKRDEHGQLSVSNEKIEATRSIAMGSAVITNSLFGATDRAEIPDSVAIQMANILASEIDFHKDLRKNDHFRVVYEVFTHEGQYVAAGRVLALEFFNKRNTYNAMWFSPDNSDKGAYYNFEGKNLRKSFTRSPLAFTRITSGFGTRRHPVLGYTRAHKGVDYGAPPGTPIMATSDGTVQLRETQRGYGNVIILKHHSNYSTLYAHMSRFGEFKTGDKVNQGDVIGYVGSTGLSTGPHLHYEFRVNNEAVDPLQVVLPDPAPIEGKLKEQFLASTAPLKDQLQLLVKIDEAKNTLVAEK